MLTLRRQGAGAIRIPGAFAPRETAGQPNRGTLDRPLGDRVAPTQVAARSACHALPARLQNPKQINNLTNRPRYRTFGVPRLVEGIVVRQQVHGIPTCRDVKSDP